MGIQSFKCMFQRDLVPKELFPLFVSPKVRIAIGTTLAIIGSILASVGSLFMKTDLTKTKRVAKYNLTIPFNFTFWLFGLILYSVGSLAEIAALAFAPASVLAPLNALGLIINVILARFVLNEVVSALESFLTIGACIGLVMCSVSSFLPHDESCIVSGIDSWRDPLYLLYMVICGALLLIFVLLSNVMEKRLIQAKCDRALYRHIHQCGVELATMRLDGQETDKKRMERTVNSNGFPFMDPYRIATNASETCCTPNNAMTFPTYIGFFYSTAAGIVGAQSVLQLKECMAYVKLVLDHRLSWYEPQLYFSSFFLCLGVTFQMHFLNLALEQYDASLVIPVYYVFWTFAGTLGGFVKFRELWGYTQLQIIQFVIGLLLTLLCICFIASLEIKRLRLLSNSSSPFSSMNSHNPNVMCNLGMSFIVAPQEAPVWIRSNVFCDRPHTKRPRCQSLREVKTFADTPHFVSGSKTPPLRESTTERLLSSYSEDALFPVQPRDLTFDTPQGQDQEATHTPGVSGCLHCNHDMSFDENNYYVLPYSSNKCANTLRNDYKEEDKHPKRHHYKSLRQISFNDAS